MFPLDTVKVSFILITEIYRLTYKLVAGISVSSEQLVSYIEMKDYFVFGKELRSLLVVVYLHTPLTLPYMKT